MANYDTNDLDFTWTGDLVIGTNGDIGDTTGDYLRSLSNQIRDLVKSETGDWLKDSLFSADLSDFIGRQNTRELGGEIEKRIFTKLVSLKIVMPGDLVVRVVPVHREQVLITISVKATPTPQNNLVVGQTVIISLLYDTIEQNPLFLLENTAQIDPSLR